MHAATRERRAGRLAAFACLSLMWSTPAAAQEPPSVGDAADRPGFADSPVLAGRGHILFETGFTLAHDGADRTSVRTLTWPQVELHGGLTSWLDVSVIWDGLVSARTRTSSSDVVDEDTATGLDDFRVGAKLRLVRRPRFDAAFIAYVNVPVGSDVVSRRYADPLTRLAWSVAISDRTWVNGTVDLQAVREDDLERRAKPALSAAVGCGEKLIGPVLGEIARWLRRPQNRDQGPLPLHPDHLDEVAGYDTAAAAVENQLAACSTGPRATVAAPSCPMG